MMGRATTKRLCGVSARLHLRWCRFLCTQLQGALFTWWVMGMECPGAVRCTDCATERAALFVCGRWELLFEPGSSWSPRVLPAWMFRCSKADGGVFFFHCQPA